MAYQLTTRDKMRMSGVHPDLQKVVVRALEKSRHQFMVIEGLRSIEKQKDLVASGASETMKSRHLTGHAIDLAVLINGEVKWTWNLYEELALHMKAAAEELGVAVEWGGDWKTFKDGVHFQLSRKKYPDQQEVSNKENVDDKPKKSGKV